MEKTLILLKPDCVQDRHCGEVIKRFETAGFHIRACKMMRLNSEILREHYAHVADKPFFPEISNFMQSSPVVGLILEGDDIIAKVRDMLGPTDSAAAAKGTIRGDLGKNKMINVVHASDSPESAAEEMKRFFRPEEIF
ncbi:MAG: nucleoside-diphosphate kinase [Candidatus Methylacidiphilales bacterium]